jgi:hypothetical protein
MLPGLRTKRNKKKTDFSDSSCGPRIAKFKFSSTPLKLEKKTSVVPVLWQLQVSDVERIQICMMATLSGIWTVSVIGFQVLWCPLISGHKVLVLHSCYQLLRGESRLQWKCQRPLLVSFTLAEISSDIYFTAPDEFIKGPLADYKIAQESLRHN